LANRAFCLVPDLAAAYRTPVAVAKVAAVKIPRITPLSCFVILPLWEMGEVDANRTGVVSLGPMDTTRRERI